MEIYDYDWPAMERFSQSVFGCGHRLSVLVLAAHADAGELYAESLHGALVSRADGKAVENFVRHQLKQLRDGEMLIDASPEERAMWRQRQQQRLSNPRGAGRPPKLFCRNEDEFWKCLQSLGDRFRR